MNYNWREIPACPGRYVLRGGISPVPPEKLLGDTVPVGEECFTNTPDPVFYCSFSGGGLISFKKPGGYIHTLCDSKGYERRMRKLKGEATMDVYLVQHGKAKSKEEDPERGLNPMGEEETLGIGKLLKGRVSEPLEIWHSGKKRAEETAGILAIALGITATVRKHEGLSPGDDVEPVVRELETASENIMIAGHLPYLPRLLSALLGLKDDQCPVAFRNSAVICLKKEEGMYRISWILGPDML